MRQHVKEFIMIKKLMPLKIFMKWQNATYISSALFKRNLPKTVSQSRNQTLHFKQ